MYSKELAEKICQSIAEGLSLAKICESDEMPTERTIYSWLFNHPDFLAMYDIAKEKQMEVYSNQIIDLADTCSSKDKAAVEKAKLQIYARQWVMGKLKPKKYGEKTVIAGDKDNPLTIGLAAVLDQRIADREARKTVEHEPNPRLPVIDIEDKQ